MYKSFFKRLLDVVVSGLFLLLSIPLLIICIILLYFANHGSVFFLQPRPGLNGSVFIIIKFKTMTDIKDEKGNLLPDAERLTNVGYWIRKLSLDEIPQLINVIKGDMSLVGPRPLLVDYLPLYNEQQSTRHNVRPGITGWAQVNGRNALSWNKKFEYDIYYVKHLSFGLDMKILFRTFVKVFKQEGISDGVSQTMEKFKGNIE